MSVDKPGNVIASRQSMPLRASSRSEAAAVEVARFVGISEEVEFCEHGTPGISRPIGVQVAGNSSGNYVERRAPFVEANSVGNTSVAFGLSGGKLTLAPRLSSRARPNSSSAFDRKSRLTGIAGGRRHRQIGKGVFT
ncbi:hypothetical protein [Ensifer sp. SL37]|uniref:hypothetical protein n=1 Tax=Ensifer sp. SL37 TaxID=2995137 RepID=UPI0022759387|nr:hypothetical protein [Ensifer sp. SL37]MCY1745219.1 hypothetical protein [Ensifer sp. SL37]